MPSLVNDLISSAITLSRAASTAASTSSTVAVRLAVAMRAPSLPAPPAMAARRPLDSEIVPRYGPEKIRNVAILGHSHDGKTTLAESMLFAAGAVQRMGSTDAGSATLDFEPEEHRRKISINLGIAPPEHLGFKVNLLDTPGFLDFVGQVQSALAAADGALVVTSPSAQVAVGTEVAWQHLNRDQKPRLVVVNKMDKENADY